MEIFATVFIGALSTFLLGVWRGQRFSQIAACLFAVVAVGYIAIWLFAFSEESDLAIFVGLLVIDGALGLVGPALSDTRAGAAALSGAAYFFGAPLTIFGLLWGACAAYGNCI